MWHAVKLTNGHFVVCHGALTDLSHMLCVVDNKGVVLKAFVEDSNTLKCLSDLMHLAMDLEDSIFVADNKNSRVLLLNSNLEFKRELLTVKDGFNYPLITFDERNGRLFVVSDRWLNQDHKILVFDIK